MTGKLWIPALLAAAFTTHASAHGGDHFDRHDRWDGHHHHRHWSGYMAPPPPPVYAPPRHVYPAPVAYYPPAPAYYGPPPRHGHHRHRGERDVGRAVGAIAGGAIGNQIGQGRLGPTVLGAVIGGIAGD